MNDKKILQVYSSLQSFRGISALFVVLFHIGGVFSYERNFNLEIFSRLFSFGSAGVEFFFVLSGFIIHHVHKNDLGDINNVKHFILKRLIRVFPVYWMVFFLILLLKFITYIVNGSPIPYSIYEVVMSFFLLPENKLISNGTGSSVVSVAWTLQFEVFFYLCFALSIINKYFPVFFLVLYFLLRSFVDYELLYPVYFIVSDYILLFWFGIIVSYLSSSIDTSKIIIICLVFSVGLLFFFAFIFDFYGVYFGFERYRTIVYGIIASIVIYVLVTLERLGSIVFNGNFFCRLGSSSYVLYLIHFPLIVLFTRLFILIFGTQVSTMFVAMFGFFLCMICIIISYFLHIKVERPFCNFLKRKLLDI